MGSFTRVTESPDESVVQLRQATLPSLLQALAIHPWFVAFDARTGRWSRWEVWQNKDAGGTSWGHVHLDLMHPDRSVGGGPTLIEAEWRGETAERLLEVLRRSPEYPFREVYRYWPGPNSNTYAAWVLQEAGLLHDWDPRGIGRDYLGAFGSGFRRTAGGVLVTSPLAGFRWEAGRRLELHLLCLTLGLDFRPLAVRTPFGRWRVRGGRRVTGRE